MAWVTITDEDVTSRMMMNEMDAVRLQHGLDPLENLILGVVNEIRGRVSGAGFALGSGDTVPDELLDVACVLVRHRVLTSMPTDDLITEARTQEAERADRILKLLSDGKFKISAPATESSESEDEDTIAYGGADQINL